MSDVKIEGRSRDHAILLLAAAEELGLDAGVVRTTTNGYLVSEEIANVAGLGEGEPSKDDAEPAPAKKAAAKKTAAKKTPPKE